MAPFKVFIRRGSDFEIKIGVPKSWRSGPISKLLAFAVDNYNAKLRKCQQEQQQQRQEEEELVPEQVHFVTSEGIVLASEEVLEVYVQHKTRLEIRDGAPPQKTINPKAREVAQKAQKAAKPAKTEAQLMKEKGWLKCKNYGCQKWYDPVANESEEPACWHHVSPPVFHDTKKGWTCCRDRLVYDWADFKLIKGCTLSRHSQVDPKVKFQASPTVVAAEAAEKMAKAKLKSIDAYKQENPNAVSAASAMKKIIEAPKKRVIRESDGFHKCQNLGCGKYYDPNNNPEGSCRYHSAKPVFHDTIKYYSCCPDNKAYDWDSFMKIPGCTTGKCN